VAKSEIVDAFEKRRACYEKAKLVYAVLKRKSSWFERAMDDLAASGRRGAAAGAKLRLALLKVAPGNTTRLK